MIINLKQIHSLEFKFDFSLSLSHPMFLNGDVGEMDKQVVQFTDTHVVLDGAESAKPQPIPNKITFMVTLKHQLLSRNLTQA